MESMLHISVKIRLLHINVSLEANRKSFQQISSNEKLLFYIFRQFILWLGKFLISQNG